MEKVEKGEKQRNRFLLLVFPSTFYIKFQTESPWKNEVLYVRGNGMHSLMCVFFVWSLSCVSGNYMDFDNEQCMTGFFSFNDYISVKCFF